MAFVNRVPHDISVLGSAILCFLRYSKKKTSLCITIKKETEDRNVSYASGFP